MNSPKLLFTEIRTPNMVPDRSADVHFVPDREIELPDGTSHFPDMSLTQQSFKDECDINYILKNNALVNPLTPEQYASLNFGDFGTSIDFHNAQSYVAEATSSFMSLPAEVRARFDNNPGRFFDFVNDDRNKEEIYQMGLATRPSLNVSEPETDVPSSKGKKTPVKPSEEAQE